MSTWPSEANFGWYGKEVEHYFLCDMHNHIMILIKQCICTMDGQILGPLFLGAEQKGEYRPFVHYVISIVQ